MGATGSGAGIVSALPTTCTACGIPIAPKAEYHLFGRGRVLCDHCLPRRTAHRAVHPECAALEHLPVRSRLRNDDKARAGPPTEGEIVSGGKRQAAEVERAKVAAEVEADRAVEQALRVVVMRRDGASWGDIAERLGISQLEAEQLGAIAYARLGAAEANQLRIEVEDRLDALVRKASVDLALAQNQAERTQLYRVLAGIEAQRSRLLGLNMKPGGE